MKNINDYITEKFKINSKTSKEKVLNKIDFDKLKTFTKEDIEKIVDFVNNMPDDVRPFVITNVREYAEWSDPSSEIFFFYTEDYENNKGFDLPYIMIYYDKKELAATIYNSESTSYHNSPTYASTKDLDKCFEFIESKYDIIKKLK